MRGTRWCTGLLPTSDSRPLHLLARSIIKLCTCPPTESLRCWSPGRSSGVTLQPGLYEKIEVERFMDIIEYDFRADLAGSYCKHLSLGNLPLGFYGMNPTRWRYNTRYRAIDICNIRDILYCK